MMMKAMAMLSSRARSVGVVQKRCLSVLPQHRESATNSSKAVWKWTPESLKQIETTLAKYPSNYKASATIPLLWIAQRQNENWIPLVAMNAIAEMLDVPPIRVYETCTFYTMFNREPVGKYHIQLCGTTHCMVRGAKDVKKAVFEELGIRSGETTEDKMFTMTEVECLGACVNAPMIQLNDDYVEDLTEESTKSVIRSIKAGKGYTVGPQNGRKGCIGPLGKTSLKEDPPAPFCRDLETIKKDYEAAKAKKD